MDKLNALATLSALAQESRLDVFRLLLRRGAMPAGAIAHALDVPHNTLSAQLSILTGAGLLQSRRNGRSIIYTADLGGIRGLLGFLVQDCCQGNPQICAPLVESLAAPQGTAATTSPRQGASEP